MYFDFVDLKSLTGTILWSPILQNGVVLYVPINWGSGVTVFVFAN